MESDSSRTATRVLLVDTVGELGGWWGCAQIGFVGGSMGTRGGQNMIEPSAYGVATCFGPNTKNFRDIVEQLQQADAVQVVIDEDSMLEFVNRCLENPQYQNALGKKAQALVKSQRGSTDLTTRLLIGELSPKSVAFAQQTSRMSNNSAENSPSQDEARRSRRGA